MGIVGYLRRDLTNFIAKCVIPFKPGTSTVKNHTPSLRPPVKPVMASTFAGVVAVRPRLSKIRDNSRAASNLVRKCKKLSTSLRTSISQKNQAEHYASRDSTNVRFDCVIIFRSPGGLLPAHPQLARERARRHRHRGDLLRGT